MAKKKRGPYNLSDEERAKRKARALELHKAGKFGGKQPGAGPKPKKTASEIVAAKAAKEAKKIVAAFSDALEPHNPASVRVQAATQWIKLEQEEKKLKMEEERHVDQLQTNQLIEFIQERFDRLNDAGILRDVVDAEVVDSSPEGSKKLSQGHDDPGEAAWSGWSEE